MLRQLFLLLILGAALPAAAAECGRLLVSGYHSTVHVYDACSGAFLRELGPRSQLPGAQAVRLQHGMLYVVAEGMNAIARYRADTLAFVDYFIQVPGNPGITGIAFGPDGDVYLGGYNTHSVMRFDGNSGAAKGTAVAPRAAGLAGIDNGLIFGPDGKLYIPGFDSHSVARFDPASGTTEVFIPSRRGGLSRTRGILFEPGGEGILVSSEGSRQILRYRRDGSFDRVFASFNFGPNGIDYGPNGELLVTGYGGDRVERLDPRTGAVLGTLVPTQDGGLSGATFLTYLAPSSGGPTVDASQIGSQYWLSGAGVPQGKVLSLDLTSSTGTTFGANYDAARVQTKRWGSLRIEFTGCDSAEMRWNSTGTDSAGFGEGGYRLQRLAANLAGRRCDAANFASQTGIEWMAGTWYGGAARSGEGLLLDVLNNGAVLVAFFTHRP